MEKEDLSASLYEAPSLVSVMVAAEKGFADSGEFLPPDYTDGETI